MCTAPKVPKVEPVPQRVSPRLPDGGDPAVREAARGRRRTAMSSMIFANGGALGAPSVSGLGVTGSGM